MSINFEHNIDWFAERMKIKMGKSKNLVKPHWNTIDQFELWERALEELEELRKVIMTNQIENVIEECCDVANFCMMIADNHNRKNKHVNTKS